MNSSVCELPAKDLFKFKKSDCFKNGKVLRFLDSQLYSNWMIFGDFTQEKVTFKVIQGYTLFVRIAIKSHIVLRYSV